MPPRRRSSSAPPPPDASSSSTGAAGSVATSLLHSLQAWPVRVVVSGRGYEIPAAPASLWVAALLSEDMVGAFLDLLDEQDTEEVWDRILTGEADVQALQTVVTDTITLMSGRPWWFTLKLLYAAQGAWDTIGGFLALKGVRADLISLQAYMDALLGAVLRHVEAKNQTSFLARLKLPPPGQQIQLDEKKEADAFMAYMSGR